MIYNSPFNLDNNTAYEAWRADKLEAYPVKAEQLIVEINDPHNLSSAERQAINKRCKKTNMAIYVSGTGDSPDKSIPVDLAKQFGLEQLDGNMGADEDGITSLKVQNDPWHKRYIPYTNKTIHWHTDGYYNAMNRQIMALNLHCVRPAQNGGANAVMDHEIAYIMLRDKNPEYIQALMQIDAMTIPPNITGNVELRPARSGPVFSVINNQLHMRYTARSHNVLWKKNDVTRKAVTALTEILKSDSPYIYRLTLQSGWGLISNNILHDRASFTDDESHPRLLYRSRFYDPLLLN